MNTFRQRPHYGIDAPGLVRALLLIGGSAVFTATAVILVPWSDPLWWSILGGLCGCVACYTLGLATFMIYYSTIVKLHARERLLDLLPWSGSEAVLDVGCGRGLMLVGAAKRLTTGTVVGIDLWKSADQSGNHPEAPRENALLEGVAERVTVQTADMRQLPFTDAVFDVVLSHWAVHNLPDPTDRATAIQEMIRVLKPSGHVILADIENHAEYTKRLQVEGMTAVREVEAGWRTTIAAIISLGNFRPAAIVARKSAPIDDGQEANKTI